MAATRAVSERMSGVSLLLPSEMYCCDVEVSEEPGKIFPPLTLIVAARACSTMHPGVI